MANIAVNWIQELMELSIVELVTVSLTQQNIGLQILS